MSFKNDKIVLFSSAGSVVSGLFASLCCIGPLIFVLLGLSGAAFFANLQSYRWLFGTAALVFLALGFFFAYRESGECSPDSSCAVIPRTRKLNRIILWIAAILVIGFIFSPNIIVIFVT